MKKVCLALFMVCNIVGFAQNEDTSRIKLFIDLPGENIDSLDSRQKERLLLKIIQMVNKTGVAEVGYSNFLIYPHFDLLDVEYSDAGIQKIYVAKCQLSLFVSRRSYNSTSNSSKISAVYASESFDVSGTGYTKSAAINNAVNNIATDNKKMIGFISKAKVIIVDYFNKNCPQIIAEADQANELKDYARAISLFFSIPSSAPCYEIAKGRSIGVYKSYQEDLCHKKYIEMKAILASVRSIYDSSQVKRYTAAIKLLAEIDPNTTCYKDASMLLNSVDARFTDEQKKEWQLTLQKQKNAGQYENEMLKIMKTINANYRPSDSPGNVYINTNK